MQTWCSESIPKVFREELLEQRDPLPVSVKALTVEEDPYCLALIQHFASLVPIAQQARKPMFDLKQRDGIGGGQIQAVVRCRRVFEELVRKLVGKPGETAGH